jgi:hypothetical protein
MLIRSVLCIVLPLALVVGCEKSTVEGPGARKITLVKPADQSVQRGSTEKVAIVVARSNFDGPVTIAFDNLPKGVSVADDGGKLEGNERTFVLTASADADLVDRHAVSVTARGPDGMSVTEQFRLSVQTKS